MTGTAGATMSTTTECCDSFRRSGARSVCGNQVSYAVELLCA